MLTSEKQILAKDLSTPQADFVTFNLLFSLAAAKETQTRDQIFLLFWDNLYSRTD